MENKDIDYLLLTHWLVRYKLSSGYMMLVSEVYWDQKNKQKVKLFLN